VGGFTTKLSKEVSEMRTAMAANESLKGALEELQAKTERTAKGMADVAAELAEVRARAGGAPPGPAGPAALERDAIVNIVHIYIFDRGAPMFVHSGAARAGVVNMTRSLAPYLEQRGVTINALAPGGTVSAAAAANYGKTEDEFRALSGRVRAQEPEDIAACVLLAVQLPSRAVIEELIIRPR
jgi:NAD(P)-dependent dehydrogenase (short-subunit alcohol dehydrogenase family)